MFAKFIYFNLKLLICISMLTFISVKSEGLYNETIDDVIILTDKNFDQEVIRSPNAWLVEFYNSWCGHCIRFAPQWKQLATECKGWSEVLKIGAIDCANSQNQQICMHYKLEGYPTMIVSTTQPNIPTVFKFLGANSLIRPNQTNMESWESVERMKSAMIDYLPEKSSRSVRVIDERGPVPRECEKIILDRFEERKRLKIRRMVISNRRNVNNNDDVIDIISYLKLYEQDLLSSLTYSLNTELPLRTPFNKSTSLFLIGYLDDLIRVNEGVVGGLQRLKFWLQGRITSSSPPPPPPNNNNNNNNNKNNNNNNNYINNNNNNVIIAPIKGIEWLTAVEKAFQTTNLPKDPTWSQCTGSSFNVRGYPCSLWLTFHAVITNVAHNHNDSFQCLQVLQRVRGYVQHFFGCSECVSNFLKGATKIEKVVTNCRQSVLFLWRSHNKANFRLRGDNTEDPRHPKTIFPNVKQCSECFDLTSLTKNSNNNNNNNNNNDNNNRNRNNNNSNNNNNNSNTALISSSSSSSSPSISGITDGWNEYVVLNFLESIYLKSNVVRYIPVSGGQGRNDDVLEDAGNGGDGVRGVAVINGASTVSNNNLSVERRPIGHRRRRDKQNNSNDNNKNDVIVNSSNNKNDVIVTNNNIIGTIDNKGVMIDNLMDVTNSNDKINKGNYNGNNRMINDQGTGNFGINIGTNDNIRESPLNNDLNLLAKDRNNRPNISLHSYISVLNIFTSYDVGLCLAFYLCCALLLIILYLHMMRKFRLCSGFKIGFYKKNNATRLHV
ncbi:hypothetical protein HELRODRAFT_192949 [Helobdella robusta]|uniref:Sulfhydryl oxidase n=1 Tax=Helobdella robusta TaxID=6412 RepID=T1FUG1_HELRO|nr:hypothetical protein HELRODRAFT_192949 [Helobdella robusta]ESN98479.1 hypothetical protein HELRODRAFT_192949 [Helobdella robusta]